MTAKGVVGAMWPLNSVNEGRIEIDSSYLCFKLFIDLVTIRPASLLGMFLNPFPKNLIITSCELVAGAFRRLYG